MSELPPKLVRELPRAFIIEKLEQYYGMKPPAEAVETGYSMWQCSETSLEFAWPMLPGNACFYAWLSGFPSYYPVRRWEYAKVRRLIQTGIPGGRRGKVLDVGGGNGDFLGGLDFVPRDHRFALDLNASAVQACRNQGFSAFCGTIEQAVQGGFVPESKFSLVTSFHCLEHVASPMNFVRSLVDLLVPGGRLFISTPYSPMSFELDWFDILNHPPHHLTRWNLKAYQSLAKASGLKMRYFFPRREIAARHALHVFQVLQYGPKRSVGKSKLLRDLVGNFPRLLSFYRRQIQRKRAMGGFCANVILVELTLP